VAERELFHVAVQMFGTHEVVDANVTALEKRPEAFNAVGVRHVADVFANRVVYANVLIASGAMQKAAS